VPGGPGHLTIGRGHLITIADTLIPVAATEDGKAYLSPRAICDSLGIDWPTQRVKIKEDPVLSVGVVEIPMPSAGGPQRTMMLNKEMVPGWLFTIKKVHPDIQAKLNRFRLECFVALDTWLNKGRLVRVYSGKTAW
jgi:hypothetical protein